jgi:hypothetical protein
MCTPTLEGCNLSTDCSLFHVVLRTNVVSLKGFTRLVYVPNMGIVFSVRWGLIFCNIT